MLVIIVSAVLLPVVIVLWPGAPVSTLGTSVSQDHQSAVISDVAFDNCDNVSDEVPCGSATGTLDDGTTVEVMLYRNAYFNDVSDGDTALISEATASDGDRSYTYYSPQRSGTLAVFALGALGLVALAVGFRGLRAFVSLLASAVFIWYFLIGGIAADGSPLLYSSVTVIFVLTAVLFYTHGLSAMTIAAWLGTLIGLCVAMAVGTALSRLLRLGPAGENAEMLTLSGLTVPVEAIALAALLILLIGVLNDISAAQASTVFTHLAAGVREGEGDETPSAATGRRSWWRTVRDSSLNVGRDHAASAIYTVSFSVVGAGLYTLILSQTFGLPLGVVLQSDEVATTLTQMIAGIVGIVVTMPATTAVAVTLARRSADSAVRRITRH